MKRVLAWAVFLAILIGGVRLVRALPMPWSAAPIPIPAVADPATPAASALWVPSCTDKPECSE